MTDLQILTQLLQGHYLSDPELERARELVYGLQRELESRVRKPETDHVR